MLLKRNKKVVLFFLILSFRLVNPPSLQAEQDKARVPVIDVEVEDATRRGLDWLSKALTKKDGSIIEFHDYFSIRLMSLAGLAFLSEGSTPRDGKYSLQIRNILNFLLQKARPSGLISEQSSVGEYLGEHAFATLFLSQVRGMQTSSDKELREKLELAVDFIVGSQLGDGSWSDSATPSGNVPLTVAQVSALRAARDAGVVRSRSVIILASKYLENMQTEDGSFLYGDSRIYPNPHACFVTHSYCVWSRSVSGLLGLYRIDAKENEEQINKAVSYLKGDFVTPTTPYYRKEFDGKVINYYDHYGLFYQAQAFWLAGASKEGASQWNEWYKHVGRFLLQKQLPDGKWSSEGLRTDTSGDVHATAIALIVLQMPNDLLPIFQR